MWQPSCDSAIGISSGQRSLQPSRAYYLITLLLPVRKYSSQSELGEPGRIVMFRVSDSSSDSHSSFSLASVRSSIIGVFGANH